MKNSSINVWKSNLSSLTADPIIIPETQGLSPSNRKCSSDLFVTQSKYCQDKPNEVLERHAELNGYIDILDEKIQKIVQHNEAEILFAYRNHLVNVKKQMEEIKEKATANANSSSSQLQKIQSLEKQLIIFRDESLKLFQKIVQKDRLVEEMSLKLDELRAQKRHMDNCVKTLTKRNKHLQGIHAMEASNTQQQNRADSGLSHIQVSNLDLITNYKPYYYRSNRGKERPFTSTANANLGSKINPNHRNLKNTTVAAEKDQSEREMPQICKRIRFEMMNCEQKIVNKVVAIVEDLSLTRMQPLRKATFYNQKQSGDWKRTRFSMRSKSNYTTQFRDQKMIRTDSLNKEILIKRAQAHTRSQSMLEFFEACVETVKKQIVRRKDVKSINFFKEGCPISLAEFKKIDFFRLLEIVFAHQNIIKAIYDTVFAKKE